MNSNMQKITLDLNDNKPYAYMYSKQYDEGRQITFHITQDGQPFDTTDCKATFQMKKPDGTVILNDYEIADGKFTVTLTNQMTICSGNRIPFQIQLIKVTEEANPVVLTTVTGYLKVSESVVHPDDVISSDEFNALTHALIKVEELNIEITKAEEIRQSNEESRKENEIIRQRNESERKKQEAIRQANEENRVNTEQIRCQNEETRQSNETIRKSNEVNRQNDTADAIARSNTATTDCINATTDLQNKLSEHYFLLSSDKGFAGGVAELDETGLVPSSQLPSYVDDVIEGYYEDEIFYQDEEHSEVISGETGKIYIDLVTNKTYRWSGTTFVVISETLALGETSSTAYRGDRGKIAYDHALSDHARADATKTEKSDENGNLKINEEEITVYTHPDSGATAGFYGDSFDQTPIPGGTFKVPYMAVDAMGHVTEVNEHTVTLPTTPIIIDNVLSTESTNPVENRVVANNISSILTSKQNTITGAASSVVTNNLTASRAVATDGSGKLAAATTTTTELNYVHGVTSAIQTQLNNKAASSHTHSYLPLSGGTMTGSSIGFTNGGYIQFNQSQLILLDPSQEGYGFGLGVVDGVWTICPGNNGGGHALGTPNAVHRWRNCYLTNQPNVSSDRNLKDNIKYLEDDDIYMKLFMKLLPCSFMYKNIENADNHDRTHVGFIAQDVESAMEELGLTSLDFAGFCKDQKMVEKVIKQKTIIFDEESKTEKEVEIEKTIYEPVEREYIYSLKYGEFIGLIVKAVQMNCNKIDSLESRLAAIEKKLDEEFS